MIFPQPKNAALNKAAFFYAWTDGSFLWRVLRQVAQHDNPPQRGNHVKCRQLTPVAHKLPGLQQRMACFERSQARQTTADAIKKRPSLLARAVFNQQGKQVSASPLTHKNHASCGFSFSTFECSLFSAARYAFADAATISGSVPTPFTIRPLFDNRTVTSPCACVPVVIAFTEYSTSSAPLFTFDSMATSVASTGPLPRASA